MPVTGQFKTIRGEGGRIRKTTPEEREAALTAGGVPPLRPEPEADFIREFRDEPQAEPPPLPPLAAEVGKTEEEQIGTAAKAAAGGATAGAARAPKGTGAAAGAIVGAAGAFLLSQAMEGSKPVVGTLEGPTTTLRDDPAELLRLMVGLQQTASRVGFPIKGEVKTNAQNSRW